MQSIRRRAPVGRQLGRLARIRPIAAIPFANESKKAAVDDRSGAHHAEHVDRATGRAGRRLGALGIRFEHTACIHHARMIERVPQKFKVFES